MMRMAAEKRPATGFAQPFPGQTPHTHRPPTKLNYASHGNESLSPIGTVWLLLRQRFRSVPRYLQ